MDEDAMLAELLNPQFRAVPGAASPGTSQAVTPDGSFFLPQDELLSADGMDPFLRALEAEDRTLEEKLLPKVLPERRSWASEPAEPGAKSKTVALPFGSSRAGSRPSGPLALK